MPVPVLITITEAAVKFADTEAGLDAGVEYGCQVIEASINATPNLQTVPATFCAPESQVPAATGYELALTWLQDWTAPGGGLSGYAFANDAATKWFSIALEATDPPLATGQCRVVAGAYGGPAGAPLQTSAVWPVAGKPTITTPAPVGLEADEAEVPA